MKIHIVLLLTAVLLGCVCLLLCVQPTIMYHSGVTQPYNESSDVRVLGGTAIVPLPTSTCREVILSAFDGTLLLSRVVEPYERGRRFLRIDVAYFPPGKYRVTYILDSKEILSNHLVLNDS